MSRSKRSHDRCPACGYDVTDQLRIGVHHCPDCGGPISRSLCAPQTPLWRTTLAHLGILLLVLAVGALLAWAIWSIVVPHTQSIRYRRAAIGGIIALALIALVKLYAWLLEVVRQRR
ncbi:MAG TPA: hypothetical protein VG797_01025 [Phycisphaerales bacterium]|nr:hypothetical protein [Phycisphaerales bacterium]